LRRNKCCCAAEDGPKSCLTLKLVLITIDLALQSGPKNDAAQQLLLRRFSQKKLIQGGSMLIR